MIAEGRRPEVPMPLRQPPISSDLKVKAAWLYHVEGLTQEQVAARLDLSRVKVMRLLAECVAEGLVITRINQVAAAQVALERALERRFGLAAAVVFPRASSAEGFEKGLQRALAGALEQLVEPGMVVAVGSGATLFHSLRHIAPRELGSGAIVGMVGALPHSGWINPSSVALRMGERFGVISYQITAPVLVDDPALAARLWQQRGLRELREKALTADLAVLTVGDHSRDATLFRHGLVPVAHFAALGAKGAVANLLCRTIDAGGHEVDHPVNRCVMALELADVARMPQILLAAGGAHRLPAIRAAMRALPVTMLVTDEDCAAALVADAGGLADAP